MGAIPVNVLSCDRAMSFVPSQAAFSDLICHGHKDVE
jgi:hypothetical protein